MLLLFPGQLLSSHHVISPHPRLWDIELRLTEYSSITSHVRLKVVCKIWGRGRAQPLHESQDIWHPTPISWDYMSPPMTKLESLGKIAPFRKLEPPFPQDIWHPMTESQDIQPPPPRQKFQDIWNPLPKILGYQTPFSNILSKIECKTKYVKLGER